MAQDLAHSRDDYRYWLPLRTRWSDNDMLGHLNNVLYFRFFEAVVVDLLISQAGLDWRNDPIIPYAVDIQCRFRRPLSFPGTIDAGLRIASLGNSSVTYGVALFAESELEPAAVGHFVHVYVERESESPVPIPTAIRSVYEQFAA